MPGMSAPCRRPLFGGGGRQATRVWGAFPQGSLFLQSLSRVLQFVSRTLFRIAVRSVAMPNGLTDFIPEEFGSTVVRDSASTPSFRVH
jgi:hypothetical protein